MRIANKNEFIWERLPTDFLNAVKLKTVVLPLEPNSEFIKVNRKLIDELLWKNYENEARDISTELFSMGIGKGDLSDCSSSVEYLKTCRSTKTLTKLYLKKIRKIGRGETKMEEMNNIFNIKLDIANMPDETPFDFQSDAINKLNAYFSSDQKEPAVEKLGWKPALLVMPTGSGKTMTAMWFLLDKMIKNGYKVLWLAHRDLLLEQASETAKWLAKIAESENLKNLKGRIVSGFHCTPTSASFASDDIIFYSIQTLGRNFDKLEFMLKGVQKDKFIVVIDEAHHTPMHTYRKMLELLKNYIPDFKLLGLTATPYRMIYTQRTVLNHIYNSNYISCISMTELINGSFLAKPHPEIVHTDFDLKEALTEEEIKEIYNYGEITSEIADKIAVSKKRNHCILKQYLENKDKYGKTIMFAVNQIHAMTLSKDLQANGIRADYVINEQGGYNREVINKFKRNELDVIVNVQILTEGSDIPDVKTVFLTRPTQSESLLLQMIGRALRGPLMHGTDIAYIVDFNDKWPTFQKWLNPAFLLEQEEHELIVLPPPPDTDISLIDPRLIWKIYSHLNQPDYEINSYSSLPHGWYSLGYADELCDVSNVLVYDNARTAFDELEKDYKWIIENKANVKMVYDKYFSDTWDPLPSDRELLALISTITKEGKLPEYYEFKERDEKADARIYAHQLIDGNIFPKEQKAALERKYEDNPIIEQIYGDFNGFFSIAMKYYNEFLNPTSIDRIDNIKPQPASVKPTARLSSGPKYDLNLLFEKVITEMFHGKINKPAAIAWSNRTFKGMWGYFRSSDRKLIMNCLLDSPDIPQNVVEYVLYHELLHADGNMTHNKAFRTEEHKFPNWQECDNFVDTIHEKFDLGW